MNNRLSVTPLLEENMNQMVDGEFSINQINGHVTIKRENEYLSKTKELLTRKTEDQINEDELRKMHEQDQKNFDDLKPLNEELRQNNDRINELIKHIDETITKCENDTSNLQRQLSGIDDNFMDDVMYAQEKYGLMIKDALPDLADALVEFENMSLIEGCESYFTKYIKNRWYVASSNVSVSQKSRVELVHKSNLEKYPNLTDRQAYADWCERLRTELYLAPYGHNIYGETEWEVENII